MVEVASLRLAEAVVYPFGQVIGPRLVTVPVVAPKGSCFWVYHSAASSGRHVMFAACCRWGSNAIKVAYSPSGL